MPDPLLEVRDLSTRQISGVHFQLRAGEILAVEGAADLRDGQPVEAQP